jgi:two-component system, cell cycle sensor histidine kinase and response regulator CckA
MTQNVLIAEEGAEVERHLGQDKSAAAYHFTYAVGYAEATQHFTANEASFDFLVTDVMLRPFQGRDLANRLVGLNPRIMVLFMGKHPARHLRSTGLLPASAPFLHKPFTPYRLIQALDELALKGPCWLDLILWQNEDSPASF